MSSTQGRLTLAAAAATLLLSLTLAPLLQGVGWLVAVIVVVGIISGVGAATRQLVRWWPLVLVVQLLAFVLTLTWLFARDAAVLGLLPGPDVVRVMTDLVSAGLSVTRQEAPPVESTTGVIFMVTGGIGVVTLLVDVIAVSLRRPAVAGLPLLAVYCVPAAVLGGGLSWWFFVAAGVGYLLLVGADSADRVRGWGRVLGGPDDPQGERALGGPLSGARRLTAVCLVLAAVVPATVPGLDQAMFGSGSGRGHGKGGNIVVINPILKLRENLTARNNVVVIRYKTTADQPEPLRIVSDDTFTGNDWSPSVGSIPRDNRVQDGLTAAPGLSPLIPTRSLQTEIDVLDLRQTYLPLPYPTTKVDIKGDWLYDSRSLNVVGDNITTRFTSYTVQHLAVVPTAQQLNDAPAPKIEVLSTYAALPPGTPRQIGDIARKVAGSGTSYSKALALQQWFRSGGGFNYNPQVLPPKGRSEGGGNDAVLAFLRDKQGYCVQFASAMAVMARTLNIPARVAVGFLPGTRRSDGTWEISVQDAHAWPELYFEGIGWVRFEPTPAARVQQPPPWAVPAVPNEPAASPSASASARPSATSSVAPRGDTTRDTAAQAPQRPLMDRILAAIPWRWLAVLLVLLALGAVPMAAASVVGRSRWRRAAVGPPAVRAEVAWDELRRRLEDLGIRWVSSWTPRALQRRLIDDHHLAGSAQIALGRLVTDLERARYAPPGGVAREVADLQADVSTVIDTVAASTEVERRDRRRARWLPRSGVAALTQLLRRADAMADQAGQRVSELGTDVRKLVGRR
jgi:transglutaminase-like putative cysteine protease